MNNPVPGRVTGHPIRVLVVDDSAYARFVIRRHLEQVPDIEIAGFASDGRRALEMIGQTDPDVITLDVAMPHMDGLATLREIMRRTPRPVVMVSSLTTEGASETVRALMIGAVDFVAKPTTHANIGEVMDEVVAKIRLAAQARVDTEDKESLDKKLVRAQQRPTRLPTHTRTVVIGASTGGPRALNTVLAALPANFSAALLIVQHMPLGFTKSLAERLNLVSPIPIKEAEEDDLVEAGKGLVAPGGWHMLVNAQHRIVLSKANSLHGVRPAIDLTLQSVADHFKEDAVGVVLTGMGVDGTMGARRVRAAGGYVIAEDESTCVVWGMPRSVKEAGVANAVVPLDRVADEIQLAVARPTATQTSQPVTTSGTE